jgi:hypothetical protein
MQLELLVKQVAIIETVIGELSFAMRHTSPLSVDALRKQKEELELVLDELLESCVVSNFDLEFLLGKNGECLRECFRPSYTGKPVVLPRPKWDNPPPPIPPDPPVASVPGVNLIVYIDTSGSMKGTLSASGYIRKALLGFANYLKNQSVRANIPCTVSLVWYGDKTDTNGDGANYYTIAMNKGDVANFESSLSAPKWYSGGSNAPESGILAMKDTLATVVKSGVANTLIYITDAPSKLSESGASPNSVKALFDSYDIQRYAIIPTSKEPNINSIFNGVMEYTKPPYDMIPWADKTLNP